MSRSEQVPAAIPLKRKTWHEIRQELAASYGRWYSPGELRTMELKWRRAFSEAGWSVKGA